MAEEFALSHHERWHATGDPRGPRTKSIPLTGRVVAVADVFDALTHRRPYKEAWPVVKAVREIVKGSGTHFDPEIVAAFVSLDHERLVLPEHIETAASAVPPYVDGTNRQAHVAVVHQLQRLAPDEG